MPLGLVPEILNTVDVIASICKEFRVIDTVNDFYACPYQNLAAAWLLLSAIVGLAGFRRLIRK